ncbi:hypothetical protein LTR85_002814 [Meristemomyces frigidus]|nr:hypothetical protein LTR85_002814 [Meristemomyces frigidus]
MPQTIVPYGFGIGDFLDVGALARSFYQTCECRQLAAEAKQLDGLLSSLKDVTSALSLSDQQQEQLADHLIGCKGVLEEMKATVERYRGPDSDNVTWRKRLCWNNSTLLQLRVRLTAQLSMLHMLHTTWSQLAVLNALHTSSRHGKTPSAASLSKASEARAGYHNTEWAEIISPLEDMGISAAVAVAHKDLILTFFQNAHIAQCVSDSADSESWALGTGRSTCHGDHGDLAG